MGTWRQALEVVMTDEEVARLMALSRSRTEPASRVERAQMLLAYRENPSFFAVGKRLGVHHQTVQRCIERALAYGPLMALDDRPRPGKEPTITPEAKAWLVSLGATRPRSTAIRTSCGRRVCWRGTRASMARRPGMDVSPILSKARCARFSARTKSNRIRCVTIWNAAMPSSSGGWRKFCASIARSRS